LKSKNTTIDEKERPFKSLNLIFDLGREKLHFQSEQWNSIDQKNAIVLAVYGILLAFVSAVDIAKFGSIPIVVIGIIIGVLILLIALGVGCSIFSLIPRDIDMPPNIKNLSEKHLSEVEYDTKNILLSTVEKSIDQNDKILQKKTEYLSLSITYFLSISIGISILLIFLKIIFWRV